jgi:hypothetical protein
MIASSTLKINYSDEKSRDRVCKSPKKTYLCCRIKNSPLAGLIKNS